VDIELSRKLSAFRALMREFGSVVVSYSGGVDSALVMVVAGKELGNKALAAIGASPSFPARERVQAIKLAEQFGVKCQVVDTGECMDPGYQANTVDRCYLCKNELYDRMGRILETEKLAYIIDGQNADDISDDRPGMKAGREHRVRSPLRECGITKTEVRVLAHQFGLPCWDKPAMACLSSRVPRGMSITPQILKQIEQAEDILVSLGFRQYRVRHHQELARIEMPAGDFAKAIELRNEIVNGIRKAGYAQVTLDLAGFRAQADIEEANKLVNLITREQW
jgi:pyridinium-3,5-biscarboxylic acid mononucleotide sulfurtransferase